MGAEACQKCPAFSLGLFIAGIMFALFAIYMLWRVSGYAERIKLMYMASDSSGLEEHLSRVTKATSAFILVNNHFQLTSICLSFSVGYPTWFIDWIIKFSALFGLSFGTMASPECTTGSLAYQWMWTLNTGLPVLFVIIFGCASMCTGEMSAQFIKTATLIVSFTFAPTLGSALSVSMCEENMIGDMVMVASPAIACDSQDSGFVYLACMASMITFIYFGGSTLGVLLSTGHLREHFQQDHHDSIGTMWVVATNLYKSISVFSGTILESQPLIQVSIMLVSATAMAVGSRKFRPHDDVDDDNSEDEADDDEDQVKPPAVATVRSTVRGLLRRPLGLVRDCMTLRPIHKCLLTVRKDEVDFFFRTGNMRPNYAVS
jgi:hypothetical protein